jgi:unsaturated rhamnogalacturonyl hydrolase
MNFKLLLFLMLCALSPIRLLKAQTTNWGVQFSDAIITRYQPTINKMTNKGWEYSNSIILHGMERIYEKTKNTAYLNYIKAYIDSYIGTDGTSVSALMEKNLDVFHPGLLCLFLYNETGEIKYKTAAGLIRKYLDTYPRTASKGFWHKSNYANQMWLDGIYMASPFIVKYGFRMNDTAFCNKEATFQPLLLNQHAFDPAKNLLYHGWDESITATWANTTTGVSPEVWSRALGWYAMAMVDILKYIPDDYAMHDSMQHVLKRVALGIKNYQDATTGLWYQVVDKGSESGNWIETSGSGMFVYALKTAVDYGFIDTSYLAVVRKGWKGLQTKIGTHTDGLPNVKDFAAAMGIKNNYSSYVSSSLKVTCPAATGTQHPHGYCAILMASSVMEYDIPKQYRLQIYSDFNGSISTSTNELYQSEGTSVTVTATPNSGYKFSHWSGDASGTNAILTVTMDSHKHIKANFISMATSEKTTVGNNVQTQFTCYPSVTKDYFNAKWITRSIVPVRIALTDMQGKIISDIKNIKTIPGINEYKIQLTDFRPGIYFCRLTSENSIFTKKVIKI